MTDLGEAAIEAVRAGLADLELSWEQISPASFNIELPGSKKLITACVLTVGQHAVTLRAFVARKPEANHAGVFRWLLERNARLPGIAFCLDALGDIYLLGTIAIASVTASEVDRLLGAIAVTADDSFNEILALGFADSIRREWAWRRSRGESTANLAAFQHLDPGESQRD